MIDTRTAPYAALLLRVTLGVAFLAHGLFLKVFVFTVAGTVGFFESVGYPGFFAYLVILGEIAGGIALIAGVYTRYVALALVPIMVGATLQHLPAGWEFPAMWTVLMFVQALLGDGAHAVKLPLPQSLRAKSA